jgi:hypothetical protein
MLDIDVLPKQYIVYTHKIEPFTFTNKTAEIFLCMTLKKEKSLQTPFYEMTTLR